MAKYYVYPGSAGLTAVTKDGNAIRIPPGATLDDTTLIGGWTPPPCAWTLRPLDATAQTNLQNAVAAAKAALSPTGAVVPGLPAGFPASIPIWAP
jgi:hypothetical protein